MMQDNSTKWLDNGQRGDGLQLFLGDKESNGQKARLAIGSIDHEQHFGIPVTA